jgi:RNA polymerase sigma-70 factor, ECF subfamily
LSGNQRQVDEWIADAASGNKHSLELVLVHFHDPLLAYIRKSFAINLLPALSPEDLLQDTMIEAFRHISVFEARGSDSFFAWLKTIARSRFINHTARDRAKKRGFGRRPVSSPVLHNSTATTILDQIVGPYPSPSQVARKREAVAAITLRLTSLQPLCQEAMDLRFKKGLSVAEVAQRLGKTQAAGKMLIHRTLKELRVLLAAHFSDL